MPPKLRQELQNDPEYTLCALTGYDELAGPCGGRLTREHALIHAGSKIQEKWAIPPICARHHGVDEYQDAGTQVKDLCVWVSLNRATHEELLRFSKAINYIWKRDVLNAKYGVWVSWMYKLPTKFKMEVDVKNYAEVRWFNGTT